MPDVIVTREEQSAIKRLKRFARKWPDSLRLFSWPGSLVVMKLGSDGRWCPIAHIAGIDNDGGDPSSVEANQDADIEYE